MNMQYSRKLRPAEHPTFDRFFRKVVRPELKKDPPKGYVYPHTDVGTPFVQPGDDCWLWTGSYSKRNPVFAGHQGTTTAKRWAALYLDRRTGMPNIEVDMIPPDVRVECLCHQPGCVNPKHHQVLTTEECDARRIALLKHRFGNVEKGVESGHMPDATPKRTGIMDVSPALREEFLRRLKEKTLDLPNGCLFWRGGTNGRNRPMVMLNGRQVSVARLIMEAAGHGPEMFIRRRCKEPRCIATEHLHAEQPFDVKSYVGASKMADTEEALARGRARVDGEKNHADDEGTGGATAGGAGDPEGPAVGDSEAAGTGEGAGELPVF